MKTVVAGALGECVHVAGVTNFLRLAEAAGWRTMFLGPAVPIEELLATASRERADLVGVSYRRPQDQPLAARANAGQAGDRQPGRERADTLRERRRARLRGMSIICG
jgi:hypothetical protein